MDKKTLKQIKEKLLERKKILEEELKQFTKPDKYTRDEYSTIFPQFGDKEDENVAEVATFSDNLPLEKNLESSLRDVIESLKRIQNKTYGICKYCHQPIDPERLLVRPVSSACISCKKKLKGEI
jgi:RNA polymerase-binding transcription factor DksA